MDLTTGVNRQSNLQQPPTLRHIQLMAHSTHYVPTISRPVVAALFHEAKRHRIPMTRLVDNLLRESLKDTPGWQEASRDWPELAASPRQDQQSR
jgi:hypothetical protein